MKIFKIYSDSLDEYNFPFDQESFRFEKFNAIQYYPTNKNLTNKTG